MKTARVDRDFTAVEGLLGIWREIPDMEPWCVTLRVYRVVKGEFQPLKSELPVLTFYAQVISMSDDLRAGIELDALNRTHVAVPDLVLYLPKRGIKFRSRHRWVFGRNRSCEEVVVLRGYVHALY